jgi:hypothetical protein
MSHLLLAEFRDADSLLEAARRARRAGLAQLDAYTPFNVAGMPDALGLHGSPVRTIMLVAGLATAAAAYALQWYSAVFDYPLDVGGRPLNSWQVFLIPSFEVGVLVAAVAGVIAMLYGSGLPSPHHLIFADGFERASRDRFFLSVGDPAFGVDQLIALLDGLGPLSVERVGE